MMQLADQHYSHIFRYITALCVLTNWHRTLYEDNNSIPGLEPVWFRCVLNSRDFQSQLRLDNRMAMDLKMK